MIHNRNLIFLILHTILIEQNKNILAVYYADIYVPFQLCLYVTEYVREHHPTKANSFFQKAFI